MNFRGLAALLAIILVSSCVPYGVAGGSPNTGGINRAPGTPEVPKLKRLANGHYRVKKEWSVDLDGQRWVVQKGYTSNGITAPAAIKSRLGDGVNHPETWAAVFHDWLFTQPGMSRSRADRLFHQVLLAYGVSAEKARLMHATVSAYSLSKELR